MTETRFLRCVNDPARRSLCDGCTYPLTCSGASDEVDAAIRQWDLRRIDAARMGICSHMPVVHSHAEPAEAPPGLLRSREFWLAGVVCMGLWLFGCLALGYLGRLFGLF